MSEKNLPPIPFRRNSAGLLEHVTYKYREDGRIDWRAMVDNKHVVVNKERFERYNKPVPSSIEGLDDKNLLVLLAGFKELADLRGYLDVDYTISRADDLEVVIKCSILFVENYETNGRQVRFSSTANASIHNTDGFGKIFLCAIAENRAFVRCVRNFLKIHIAGKDELSTAKKPTEDSAGSKQEVVESDLTPQQQKIQEVLGKVSFDKAKKICVNFGIEEAANWKSIKDIPDGKTYEVIGCIKEARKKAAEKKAK